MYFHILRNPIPYIEVERAETVEDLCALASAIGAENSMFVFNGSKVNVALTGYPENFDDFDQYRAILYDFAIATRAESVTFLHPIQTDAFELSEDAQHQIIAIETKSDLSGNAALGELVILDNTVRFRMAFRGTHENIIDANFDLFPDFSKAINHDNEEDVLDSRNRISDWIERLDWAWDTFDHARH